ncbi:hypothetical protein BDV29DRAFT_184680 [Aspergillus leporis]|jgi:hypothetical protein|uniref:Uncharacterized protein n=1 Tax=Aspergillus leporis TaxID=41062 RepID=A0A5N5WMG1_9EURO|nr:hypothetical protein BDV29DRAFT_184680 [Aspergillus leporis]
MIEELARKVDHNNELNAAGNSSMLQNYSNESIPWEERASTRTTPDNAQPLTCGPFQYHSLSR